MKKKVGNRILMVIAATVGLATAFVACGNSYNDSEQPIADLSKLYACGIAQNGVADFADASNVVFTEDDIEWFNVSTRELKFKDLDEPLYKKFQLLSGVEFRLGDAALFSGGTLVGLVNSQVFTDLVLCCGTIEGNDVVDGYYLYDCYPAQYENDEQVVANREKRAEQWAAFTKYLKSKGKLKE